MNDGRPVTTVSFSTSDAGLRARVRTPEAAHDVFIRDREGAVAASEGVGLALALLPAMRFGGRLDVETAVSPQLLAASSRIQDVFLNWDRAGALRRLGLQAVEVNAAAPEIAKPRGDGVGCFFSGGVDSFYTLLKHRAEITDIVVVHGFDVTLDNEPLRRGLSEAAQDAARTLGLRVIEIETDARLMAERYVTWNHYFGCLLAGVAYALAPRLGKIYMATGHTHANIIPDGASPILDAPWSQGPVAIVSDGLEATRTQKVAAFANDALAMRRLRVCWENRDGAYNCGRCEKCLRTKVALQAVGALERCRTMPGPLEYDALCGARFGSIDFMWREMLHDLESMNADPALIRAVRRAVGPRPMREAVWGWYRVRRLMRRTLRGGASSSRIAGDPRGRDSHE